MWPAIVSFLLGVVGWFVTSFFAKPYLDFLNLKRQVHEEVIFTANVGKMAEGTGAYTDAIDLLRRLGAKVQATNVAAVRPLRWFLHARGYDLVLAGRNLIGLSNSLSATGDGRLQHAKRVLKGLRLPLEI